MKEVEKEASKAVGPNNSQPSCATVQKIGFVLGPLLFTLFAFLILPEGLSYEGRMVLAVTLLLPIILLPSLNNSGATELGTISKRLLNL